MLCPAFLALSKEEGPPAEECHRPLDTEEGEGTDSHLEPPERSTGLPTSCLSTPGPLPDFWLTEL